MESVYWYPNEYDYSRMFTASLIIGIFVLSTAYSSNLISILTVPSIPIPINSVDEMVEQSEIGWGVEAGSIMETLGATAKPGSVFEKMHDGATYGGTCYDFKEEIKAGKMGSVCERVTIQKVSTVLIA